MAYKLLALGLLAVRVASVPTATQNAHRHGTCQQFDVPIQASAKSVIFNITPRRQRHISHVMGDRHGHVELSPGRR